MDEIINGTKNYDFRKYGLPTTVKRIWFYQTAPQSSITHICETLPCIDRKTGDAKLTEDGRGNKEYNDQHKDFEDYDYAYKILSVYEIKEPLTLQRLMDEFGMKSAPRGFTYVRADMAKAVPLQSQTKVACHVQLTQVQ